MNTEYWKDFYINQKAPEDGSNFAGFIWEYKFNNNV